MAMTQAGAQYAILITLYLSLNSTLNLANKYVLGMYGFSFPLLLTTCHMLFSFLALAPFMFSVSMRAKHAETLGKQWKGIVAIGVFMATNIALNNTSLVAMTLTLNQIIRCECDGSHVCSIRQQQSSQGLQSLALRSGTQALDVILHSRGSFSSATPGAPHC